MDENFLSKAKAAASVIKDKAADLKENLWDDEKKKSSRNLRMAHPRNLKRCWKH